MKKLILLVFLFLIQTSTVSSQELGKDFKVFNALLFKNTPDLEKYGFSKINVLYEDKLISTNYYEKNKKAPNRRFLDMAKIKSASNATKEHDIPVVLDVEHWDVSSKVNREKFAKIYIELINSYRAIDRLNLVSVFHYASRDEGINNASNVAYPAFYTDDNDMLKWKQKVLYFMKNLKQYHNKNKVYAFIWPQYNPTANSTLGYTFIDNKRWRAELEYLYTICDGVIIWSHYRDEHGKVIEFDYNMPWFRETVKFINEKKINARNEGGTNAH